MAAKKTSKLSAKNADARQGRRDARLHLRLPADLLEQISQIAADDNRTAASLVVHVLTQYAAAKRPK